MNRPFFTGDTGNPISTPHTLWAKSGFLSTLWGAACCVGANTASYPCTLCPRWGRFFAERDHPPVCYRSLRRENQLPKINSHGYPLHRKNGLGGGPSFSGRFPQGTCPPRIPRPVSGTAIDSSPPPPSPPQKHAHPLRVYSSPH